MKQKKNKKKGKGTIYILFGIFIYIYIHKTTYKHIFFVYMTVNIIKNYTETHEN